MKKLNGLDKLEKLANVELKKTASKDKLPSYAASENVSESIDIVSESKIQIKQLEGQISKVRPEIEEEAMTHIVEQILDKGIYSNLKLLSDKGNAVTFTLMDSYKKLKDNDEIEAAIESVGNIVGAKNVDEFIGEEKTYKLTEDFIKNEEAVSELVEFAQGIEKKFGITVLDIVKEVKVKKGSVEKLAKFAKTEGKIRDLISVLQPTKQLK